jgi:hypothetical protein
MSGDRKGRNRPAIASRISAGSDVHTLEALDPSTPTSYYQNGRSGSISSTSSDFDAHSQTPTNGKGLRNAGAVLRRMNPAMATDDFASPTPVSIARTSGIPVMASSSLSNGNAAPLPSLPSQGNTPTSMNTNNSSGASGKKKGTHKGRERSGTDESRSLSGARSPVSPERQGDGSSGSPSPPTSLPQSPSPDSPLHHQQQHLRGGTTVVPQQRRGSNATDRVPHHFVWPDPEPPHTAGGADTYSEVIAPGRSLGLQRTRARHGDDSGDYYEPESPSPGPMMMMSSVHSSSARSLASLGELPTHPPPLTHSQSESGLRYGGAIGVGTHHGHIIGPSSRTAMGLGGASTNGIVNPSHPHHAALTSHGRSGSFIEHSTRGSGIGQALSGLGSQTPQPGHISDFKRIGRQGSVDLSNAPIVGGPGMGRRGSHSHARGPPRSLPALNNAPTATGVVLSSVPSTPTHSSTRAAGSRPELEPLSTPKRSTSISYLDAPFCV